MEKLIHNFDEPVDRRHSESKKFNPLVYGPDILPMWIADTDFKAPKPVAEVIQKRAAHEVYGYPYPLPEYQTSVQGWMDRRHNWKFDAEAVSYIGGVVQGFIVLINVLTEKSDKIACLTPLFGPLQKAVKTTERELVTSSLIYNNGHYEVNFEELESILSDEKTKMFILCNPHNPVGKVFKKEELEKIANLCLKYNVKIYSDEVHSEVVYDDNVHIPIASLSKEVSDITAVGVNPGKAFSVTGIRAAAIICTNSDIREKFVEFRDNHKLSGRTVMGQHVFITCFNECDYYIDQQAVYLQKNRDYLYDFIKENIPEIKFDKPEAGFLMWLDCNSLQISQEELMKLFEEQGKIAFNSGESFGKEGIGFVRMNTAVQFEVLKDACQRIKHAVDYWRAYK